MTKRLVQCMINLYELVIGGYRLWGFLRLFIVLCIIIFCANWDRFVWNELGSEPASLIWWWGLRFWILPLSALVGAFLAGSLYVMRLYVLRRQRLAWRYLIASAVSIGVPSLVIKDGQPLLSAGQENPVLLIGGPAQINIRSGSAVVVEMLHKPTRVLGAGLKMLTRLERLRGVISLSDQHGMTDQVTASTKDGIELAVQCIQYRYRLHTGRQPRDYRKRIPQDPYPFSSDAAFKLAYQRTAFADGSLNPWERIVKIAVDGVITDYINSNQFDFVATPDREMMLFPRQTMIDNMQARNLRNGLRGVGTELLWFDIGAIKPMLPEVNAQWVNTWGATWSSLAALEQARGEGQRISVQEIARAESQAALLESIVDALSRDSLVPNYKENIHKLIVVRTAQILEAMVESNPITLDREVPEQPPSVTRRRELPDQTKFNLTRRLRLED